MSATILEILFGSRLDGTATLNAPTPWPREVSSIAANVPHGNIVAAVLDTLNVPIGNVIMNGWNKHHLVREAQKETLGPPATTEFVRLGKHSIKSTHHPRIDLDINGVRKEILKLDLAITLDIETVGVVVTGGKITGIEPGNAIVSAVLKAGEFVVREVKSKPLALGGSGAAGELESVAASLSQ